MTEIIEINQDVIKNKSTEELKQEFAKTLTVTSKYLVYMAAIWNELNNRGVDLSDLRGGLLDYIPFIATDKLDASLVIEFAGNKTLLCALSRLPIERQREIAETKKVDFVTLNDDLSRNVKQIDLRTARASNIYQVFGGDRGIRDVDEQHLFLVNRLKSNVVNERKKYRTIKKIEIDSEKKYIVFGHNRIAIDKVIEQINEAYNINILELIGEK